MREDYDFDLLSVTSADIGEVERLAEQYELEGWERGTRVVISKVRTHEPPEGVDVHRIVMRRSVKRT